MAKKVIGIDLGTTFSVAAYVLPSGEPVVIPDSQGSPLLPSVISAADGGKLLVGEEARRQRVAHPVLTISSVKRLMGKGSREINPEADYIPYPLDLTDEKIVRIQLGGKWWTPPEISALILRRLKEQAELFLHEPVESAVITVPAYFNDSQRQATKDAGRIAGLQVLRIVNEPTAASLAYGLQKKDRGKIAVYDFGGGTFDISILNVRGGIFEVLSTSGDTHLGGDDIDWKIAQTLIGEIEAGGNKISGDLELVQMIVEAAERAKIELSDKPKTEIILSNQQKNFSFRRVLEQNEFETLIRPIVEKTIQPCRSAMKDEKLSASEINEVVLVGGSTRIPLVREIVRSIFQKEPHCELNPDEVVALGAAVQAHILMGERKDMLLLDVTPLSLGIETYGGAVAKIIERNSTIPARASEVFTTFVDGQTSVDIHILQGERELAADCRSLARFQLKGIAPMPAGTPRIEVTFLIDENGILQVKARDQRGNKEQSIEVKPSYGLDEQDVKKFVREAYAHAKEDFDAHILVDVRNESAIMIRATEKALKEKGPQLSVEEKKEIEIALDQLKALVNETDHRKIREAIDGLNKKTQRLAETMLNDAVKQTLIGKKVV